MKTRNQTLWLLATLVVIFGMISWGGALNAQTTPSSSDQQSQQPEASPSQQAPQTQPTPSPEMPPSSQQTPDATQQAPSSTPDTSRPASKPETGAAAGTDSQTFSGTVTKQGDKYVLKDDSGHTYDIDHQDEVKKFDGKRVRVQGTLDPAGNKIMVK